jgi:hypothetical protein
VVEESDDELEPGEYVDDLFETEKEDYQPHRLIPPEVAEELQSVCSQSRQAILLLEERHILEGGRDDLVKVYLPFEHAFVDLGGRFPSDKFILEELRSVIGQAPTVEMVLLTDVSDVSSGKIPVVSLREELVTIVRYNSNCYEDI